MSACAEFAPLVDARLSGSLGLDPARLEAHRAGCPECDAELTSQDQLLGLATLPPPSADELRALEGLPLLTWKAMGRARVRRATLWAGGLGLGVAAALAFAIAVPRSALVPHSASRSPVATATEADEVGELDFGLAVDDADDETADDTVDLVDFASLDVAPGMSATVAVGDDEEDEDGSPFQGEAL